MNLQIMSAAVQAIVAFVLMLLWKTLYLQPQPNLEAIWIVLDLQVILSQNVSQQTKRAQKKSLVDLKVLEM